MIEFRNTTVAHCLPSFDNEMSRKIVKSKKFCYHGNMASHFSSLFCSLDHPSATISCPVNAPWLLWLATLDLILMMYNHALWLAVKLGAQWINRVIVLTSYKNKLWKGKVFLEALTWNICNFYKWINVVWLYQSLRFYQSSYLKVNLRMTARRTIVWLVGSGYGSAGQRVVVVLLVVFFRFITNK